MLSQQVQQAAPADIEEIREELAEQGYLRLRASKKRKNRQNRNPKFISSSGIPISVGKNNKQNDYLTFKLAKKRYLAPYKGHSRFACCYPFRPAG